MQNYYILSVIISVQLLGSLDTRTLAMATPQSKGAVQGPVTDCPNCVDESQYTPNKWTMPLLKLGEKRYYLGIFFKANWFKATQYCRYHGMHLASISSQEENDRLEKHIRDFGLGHEHFWISGTDLADEGNFFWMATGRPITFTNWNAGEPNNFRYENGEEENCLELWNRDGKGLKWNDSPCSFETYFVCEVQPN
ncbi:C-type lectin 37Db isoform X2 [Drosophila obscura]|uniref:C-type lectin 37Db isoform X2 n=1 Tax=Drosophila obscura TaxID=7282 RepID=UPI001BB1E5ED|nr:C-type lectin 37Db isoform X2 [Drosophila obscura]XP_022226693.2 C-type lectin 37Db isoform X2 [Drosophila obscura]